MVETSKQVRVDNWGIYFLQRLQLFFSKTDYCDLTLQFEGNVQLKVHRLVMNACTEYFAFLEQTCPALEDNTIMMPTDLQADVIVPIVNFMYTGMLEFHPSIFEKLYKAADTMNITILTKLLEAQLQRYKTKPKKEVPQSWGGVKKTQKPQPTVNELPSPLPGKKLPVWRKRQATQSTAHVGSSNFSSSRWHSEPPEKDPLSLLDNTPKPTRFEWPDDDQPPFTIDPSFDDVSLTSKPLWTKEDDQKAGLPFEETHSLAQKSRQPVSQSNSISQDAEEEYFQKEQKVNVPPPEDTVSLETPLKRKPESKVASSPKRVKITNQDDETIISIKTSNPSKLDHTKIVSEILKKYPDLVKKKKNIKLKITSTKNEPPQIRIQTIKEKMKPQPEPPTEKVQQVPPMKKEIKVEATTTAPKEPTYNNTYHKKSRAKADFRAASEEGPWTCMECLGDGEAPEFVLYYLFRKHMTDVHHMEFDSSLCKYCGKKCPTEKCMAYHLFTKHGLRPPSNIKFPQCTRCPFIGVTTDRLQGHMRIHGKEEAQCVNCKLGFASSKDLLNHHQISGHNNRNALSILDCAYCTKKLQSPVSLFTHIRTQHLKEARRDGITSLDETMDVQDDVDNDSQQNRCQEATGVPEKRTEVVISRIEEKQEQVVLKEKVNIISNVKVATQQEDGAETVAGTVEEQPAISESQPVAVATTTAAALGNIGSSLATNLGLVDIVVLDDNQQYILQQPQGQTGNTEFILPELTGNEGILQAATAAADLNSTDELVMVLTDHDYQDEQNQGQSDNSNIVVLYSHPVEGQQGQFITSQGNLLVNSQGLLEIRNGAGITTTAGQILVNSENTTTTQAVESPIESIEMIRKEIEGELGEREGGRDNVKAVLRKKEKEISKIEKEVESVQENSSNAPNNIDSNLENGTRESNASLDTTDSSIQEEPMEVDEIGPQPSENSEQPNVEGEEESPSLNNSLENQEPEITEQTIDQTNEEEAGEDVPPDVTKQPQENSEIEDTSKSTLNSSSEAADNPNDFHEILDPQTDITPEAVEDEPMEVDGEKCNESSEQIEPENQIDNDEFATEHQPNITENQTEPPEDSSLQKQPLNSEEKSADVPDQETSQVNPDQNPNVESNEEPPEENDQEQSVENAQDSSMENDQQACLESYQEPELVHNSEPNQEPVAENDQVPNLENDQAASVESDRHPDGEQNDQNDNIQPNFDDFTDESQQSSSQKTHRDLNKEILDDWDDTDSQQSQSQEQESQEEVPDQAALNAAENVNKLMDDWDEEDEEQSKE